MKPMTWALLIGGILVLAFLFGNFSFDKGTPSNLFTGRVTLSAMEVMSHNGTSYTIINTVTSGSVGINTRVLHSKSWNAKVDDWTATGVTGTVAKEDSGWWYMIIDYSTNNTAWLDREATLAANPDYVKDISGWDGDSDGFDEECLSIWLGDLPDLKAGETSKPVDLKICWTPFVTQGADITYTQLTNASGITTSYLYKTATGYESSMSEGDAYKIGKIQLSIDTTGTNETYPDLEYWKPIYLKIGDYTFSASDFGAYDLSNARFELRFGDQINHQGGKLILKPLNAQTLWSPLEMKAYCMFPAANVLVVTVNIFYYEPDGSMSTTAETWITSWTAV